MCGISLTPPNIFAPVAVGAIKARRATLRALQAAATTTCPQLAPAKADGGKSAPNDKQIAVALAVGKRGGQHRIHVWASGGIHSLEGDMIEFTTVCVQRFGWGGCMGLSFALPEA